MSRVPRAEAPARPFQVRVSPSERDRMAEAARANHQTLSQFARDAIVTAADDCLEDLSASIRKTKSTARCSL
jgi:uncharacterized protein (DUF1778 family)